MQNARLRVTNSALRGQEFMLPDRAVIVGRSSSSDIVIADQSISRQHVRIEVRDGACLVTDLGSQNGIVVRGETLREALLSPGDRFELGDVEIEFAADQARSGPVPAGVPEAAASVPATMGANLPGERAVLVDEIFGAAVSAEERGPGEEEKAAVEGARGAVRFVALVVLILATGAIAWYLAGGVVPDVPVKSVIVKENGVTVVDLGLYRDSKGHPAIDERESYDEAMGDPDPEKQCASVEIDPTHFLATVHGKAQGTEDVTLLGPNNRKAILRIMVRDIVPRPPEEERMSIEERIARAKELIQSGRAAERSDYLFKAMTQFREAVAVLKATQSLHNAEADTLRKQADDAAEHAHSLLDEQFDRIKFRALAHYRNRGLVAAAKEYEKLQNLIPDENDEMSQKLRLIFERTMYAIQRSNG